MESLEKVTGIFSLSLRPRMVTAVHGDCDQISTALEGSTQNLIKHIQMLLKKMNMGGWVKTLVPSEPQNSW